MTNKAPIPLLRDIGERLLDFSARVIKLLEELPQSPTARKIEDQLVRSAMSAGANYEEARGADSRADFCHKLQIALKETREARYWLCLAQKAELLKGETLAELVSEATQLRAILSKAVATARGKSNSA